MLKAFEHSHNITVSMIQRGYDGNMPILKHEPFKLNDIAVSLVLLAIMGALWTI
jgi:cobalt/nickel transport system permease protein